MRIQTLVNIDKTWDRLPVISTVSNIVNLFIKTVVLPFKSPSSVGGNPFYVHLKDKSFTRCIVLLIPVLGNVAVWVYDMSQRKYDDAEYMLNALREGSLSAAKASERLADNIDFMTKALEFNAEQVVKAASSDLRSNEIFMLAAIRKWHGAFEHVISGAITDSFREKAVAANSSVLQYIGDGKFLTAILKRDGLLLDKLANHFKSHQNFVETAITQEPAALQYSPLCNDSKFMLEPLKKNGALLEYAGEEILKSRDHVLAAMGNHIKALRHSPLRSNREFVKQAIQKYGGAVLQHADPALQNDRQLCLDSLDHNSRDGRVPAAWPYISFTLRGATDFIESALYKNGWVLKELTDIDRNNVKFVTQACEHFPEVVAHAGPDVMKNKGFVLGQVKQRNALALKHAPTLQNDREVVCAALDANGMALEYISEDLANDPEIVDRALSPISNTLKAACPEAAKYIGKTLLANETLMISLIVTHPAIFQFLPSYQNNRKAVLAILAKDGLQLKHVHPDLKKDKEVVVAAIKQNGMALQFAHGDLKKDWDIYLASLANHSLAWQGSPELKGEWDEALVQIGKNAAAIKSVNEKLRSHKSFLMAAAAKNGAILEYIDVFFSTDVEIVKSALSSTAPDAIFKWAPAFHNDATLINLFIVGRAALLPLCHEDIRNNKEIVKAACWKDYKMLAHIGEDLKKDDLFLLTQLQNLSADAYPFLPAVVRERKDFALKALEQNVYIYTHLCAALKADMDVLVAVLKHKADLVTVIPSNILQDREAVRVLLQANGAIFDVLPAELKADAELFQIAIQNGYVVKNVLQLAI